jgi:hypothetical protein
MAEEYAVALSIPITVSSGTTCAPYVHFYHSAENWREVRTMETIGGPTCHLCGRKMKYKNVSGRATKKRGWLEYTHVSYACRTIVDTSESGKKRIIRGSKCVRDGK